jgi:hypothetical protein
MLSHRLGCQKKSNKGFVVTEFRTHLRFFHHADATRSTFSRYYYAQEDIYLEGQLFDGNTLFLR